MALITWLLGIVILVLSYKIFIKLSQLWAYSVKIKKLPGPTSRQIIEYMWALFCTSYEDLFDTFTQALKWQQSIGNSVIGLWFGIFGKVIVFKGPLVEEIMKSSQHVNKSAEYQFAKRFLGDGLLFSKRELWEKRRKMINPSFNWAYLKGFIPMFNEKVDILMEMLEKVEEKEPFDIESYFGNCSLDILCRSILGVNVDTQRNSKSEIVIAHHDVGDVLTQRALKPWLWPSFVHKWSNLRKQEIKNCRIIRQFSFKIIQERRKYLELSKLEKNGNLEEKSENEEIFGMKRRKAMLDIMLESTCDGEMLTDEDVVDEVTIEIAAGHETTASSMSFATFLLGNHPDIQKRAQEEVDQIIGDVDRPLTSEDVSEMKFLDAVLKESYRLYPPIPVLARELDEDLVAHGYTIPAKTTILFPVFVMHRDPDVFPDPDKFDPERFLGSSVRTPTIYEYLPFSAGPRNCIGNKMAQTETKMALAKILRKYDVISHHKPEELKLAASPALRSANGVLVRLCKRGK